MMNKVPRITLYFWVIKILCTTIGETAADFLNGKFNLGLTGTTIIMGALLIVALYFQFKANKYVPTIYWIAVVLISVVGTLITDNLTDNLGVPLIGTTIVFSIILGIVLIIWYHYEKTLSIHKINSTRREAFYWLAILFTFALGTAAGDLMAESLKLGYWLSGLIFAVMIGLLFVAQKYFNLNTNSCILDSIYTYPAAWGFNCGFPFAAAKKWWAWAGYCHYKCNFPRCNCCYSHLSFGNKKRCHKRRSITKASLSIPLCI